MDVKIKKFFGIEEILEENLKRVFTILYGKFTESILAKKGGDRKYEAIKKDQYVIEMLKLIKGVMIKFEGNKEITHGMWEAYMAVIRFSQQKFETNQEFFERFKNSASFITQYERSIRQDTGIINHLSSK